MEKDTVSLWSLVKWMWRQSRGTRGQLFVTCILGVFRVACALTFIWIGKVAVDTAVGQSTVFDSLVTLGIVLVALRLFELALSVTSGYITNRAEIRMKNRMRMQLYTCLLSRQWSHRAEMPTGDLLNRLTEDVRMITSTVCQSMPFAVTMCLQLCAALVMLSFMSPLLAVCILCIMPVFLLASKLPVKISRRLTAKIRKSESLIHTDMQDGLQHHAVVQTLEAAPEMENRLGTLQENLYNDVMHRTRFSTFSRSMMSLGFMAGYLTAFLWSIWHLHTGVITFGTMTAFLQLVARIQNPMSSLTRVLPDFIYTTASIDRLIEIEALPAEEDSAPEELIAPAGIKFSDVSFRYKDDAPWVLKDFNYDFPPGTKTVVMGETGIGKSTMFKLILSLLSPSKGKVEIYDGERSLRVSSSTRCNIVYVPQGNSLLQGTIRENLQLADPDATDETLLDALHTAVADFVTELPKGLDTPCGELGTSISEGQAQRIAIARGLLRKGSILLLDEFNSSLDKTTAITLMQRLMSRHVSNTVIMISHRTDVMEWPGDDNSENNKPRYLVLDKNEQS